ncbi:MAG: GHMP kinase [Lentisphaerae bacterium]|jgi:mevalonate kinase|nr:GHMP kinase [Lentisphaerota bacterium]
MSLRAVQASAPGSLMFMGEHAVLRGQPALVCAISKRMKVKLTPRTDDAVLLHSTLGEHETTLGDLAPNESFRFVLGTIRAMRDELAQGFELDIRSGMSSVMGLGTSAAVTVATMAALEGARDVEPARERVIEQSIKVIRKVQGGVGSGADVAASVHGGFLRYTADPMEVVALPVLPQLTVLYSGYKRPTTEVVALVEESRKRLPGVYDRLEELIGEVVQRAFVAAASEDWDAVGELMNVHQGLMDALGVNEAKLSELIYALREDPNILGSKISGSGLGDCVIGLGKAMRGEWGVPSLAVQVDARGVAVEAVE